MKPGVHPDYHPVVLQDANTGTAFLTRLTITSSRTIDWPTADGFAPTHWSSSRFPLRHNPFGTESRRHSDTAGQIEKFHRRFGRRELPTT